jgi:hypothetical protein
MEDCIFKNLKVMLRNIQGRRLTQNLWTPSQIWLYVLEIKLLLYNFPSGLNVDMTRKKLTAVVVVGVAEIHLFCLFVQIFFKFTTLL